MDKSEVKTIKIIYRRNLKMSPGKLAAQCVHAAIGLKEVLTTLLTAETSVVVLEASDKKFDEIFQGLEYKNKAVCKVKDAGYTELKPGTETCFAYME